MEVDVYSFFGHCHRICLLLKQLKVIKVVRTRRKCPNNEVSGFTDDVKTCSVDVKLVIGNLLMGDRSILSGVK